MWYAVQWNYSKQDIIRAEESVLIREVSSFHIIVQEWYTICTLGRRMRGVLISYYCAGVVYYMYFGQENERCPHFRG